MAPLSPDDLNGLTNEEMPKRKHPAISRPEFEEIRQSLKTVESAVIELDMKATQTPSTVLQELKGVVKGEMRHLRRVLLVNTREVLNEIQKLSTGIQSVEQHLTPLSDPLNTSDFVTPEKTSTLQRYHSYARLLAASSPDSFAAPVKPPASFARDPALTLVENKKGSTGGGNVDREGQQNGSGERQSAKHTSRTIPATNQVPGSSAGGDGGGDEDQNNRKKKKVPADKPDTGEQFEDIEGHSEGDEEGGSEESESAVSAIIKCLDDMGLDYHIREHGDQTDDTWKMIMETDMMSDCDEKRMLASMCECTYSDICPSCSGSDSSSSDSSSLESFQPDDECVSAKSDRTHSAGTDSSQGSWDSDPSYVEGKSKCSSDTYASPEGLRSLMTRPLHHPEQIRGICKHDVIHFSDTVEPESPAKIDDRSPHSRTPYIAVKGGEKWNSSGGNRTDHTGTEQICKKGTGTEEQRVSRQGTQRKDSSSSDSSDGNSSSDEQKSSDGAKKKDNKKSPRSRTPSSSSSESGSESNSDSSEYDRKNRKKKRNKKKAAALVTSSQSRTKKPSSSSSESGSESSDGDNQYRKSKKKAPDAQRGSQSRTKKPSSSSSESGSESSPEEKKKETDGARGGIIAEETVEQRSESSVEREKVREVYRKQLDSAIKDRAVAEKRKITADLQCEAACKTLSDSPLQSVVSKVKGSSSLDETARQQRILDFELEMEGVRGDIQKQSDLATVYNLEADRKMKRAESIASVTEISPWKFPPEKLNLETKSPAVENQETETPVGQNQDQEQPVTEQEIAAAGGGELPTSVKAAQEFPLSLSRKNSAFVITRATRELYTIPRWEGADTWDRLHNRIARDDLIQAKLLQSSTGVFKDKVFLCEQENNVHGGTALLDRLERITPAVPRALIKQLLTKALPSMALIKEPRCYSHIKEFIKVHNPNSTAAYVYCPTSVLHELPLEMGGLVPNSQGTDINVLVYISGPRIREFSFPGDPWKTFYELFRSKIEQTAESRKVMLFPEFRMVLEKKALNLETMFSESPLLLVEVRLANCYCFTGSWSEMCSVFSGSLCDLYHALGAAGKVVPDDENTTVIQATIGCEWRDQKWE